MVEVYISPEPSGLVIINQPAIDSWIAYWISQGILEDQTDEDEEKSYDYKSN